MAQERECGQSVIHSNEHHAEATGNFNGTSSYHLILGYAVSYKEIFGYIRKLYKWADHACLKTGLRSNGDGRNNSKYSIIELQRFIICDAEDLIWGITVFHRRR